MCEMCTIVRARLVERQRELRRARRVQGTVLGQELGLTTLLSVLAVALSGPEPLAAGWVRAVLWGTAIAWGIGAVVTGQALLETWQQGRALRAGLAKLEAPTTVPDDPSALHEHAVRAAMFGTPTAPDDAPQRGKLWS